MKTDKKDHHWHVCQCGNAWQHHDSNASSLIAHICYKCGAEVTKRTSGGIVCYCVGIIAGRFERREPGAADFVVQKSTLSCLLEELFKELLGWG